MKLQPGLQWRLQDVGDTRSVGELLRRTADFLRNQYNGQKYVEVSKPGREESSNYHTLTSGTDLQDLESVSLPIFSLILTCFSALHISCPQE